MDILNRMLNTMKEKEIKPSQLADYLNINKSVVSTWKSRNTNPPVEYTERICKLLDISINYYITGENNKDDFTKDEMKLIDNYRKCDNSYKEKLIDTSDDYTKLSNKEGKSSSLKTG